MVRISVTAMAIGAALLTAAAAADDAKVCAESGGAPGPVIAACTRVIASGQWTGKDLAWAYANRGNAQLSKGATVKAIEDFSEALKLDPSDGNTFYNRGIAFMDKGDLAHAGKDFDSAIKLNPSDAGALASRCYVRAVQGGDLNAALDDCNKSLKLEANGYTNDSRGLVYLKLSRFEEARKDFDVALKSDAKSASSLFGRGVAKRHLGDAAGGDKDIAAAKAIDANIAKTYNSRGVTP